MMKNRHLSLISVVCLTSICFISLLWPAIAFSLTEDCVAEGTDGSLVQSGQEAFGTSGSDRLTLDPIISKHLSIRRYMNILAM